MKPFRSLSPNTHVHISASQTDTIIINTKSLVEYVRNPHQN